VSKINRLKTLWSLYDELYNDNSLVDGVLHQEVHNNWLDFWEIRIIRENSWPLMLSNNWLLDNDLIRDLEAKYWIPRIILVELFWILQNTWFLKWWSIWVAPDAKSRFTDIEEAKNKIIDWITRHDLWNTLTKDEFMESINKFLLKLSQLNIIREVILDDTKLQEIPNWLFRITSLYDTNFSKFGSLDEFLDFLFINLKEQDKLFWARYLDLLKETSWLPVDDIPWRETTRFSKDKFVVKVWELDYVKTIGQHIWKEGEESWLMEQNVDVNFRIFPWFSPTWLWFAVSLNLGDIQWVKSNSNYLAIYSLYFERRGESIIPVIHTIQNSFHNIWIDSNWKLYQVNEPLSNEERAKWITLLEESDWDEKLKKDKKQEILQSIKTSVLSWLDMNTEIIAIISDNLFFSWFPSVECINWNDNLWLTKHRSSKEGIEETIDRLYRKPFKTLWWKEIEYGYMKIDFLWVFKYLSRYPKWLDMLERISWLIGSLIWEANKLLINPTSQKNIQKVKDFNSKILEILERLNTRWTKLEHFVNLYTSMIWKQVWDLLDTSDWKRKMIIWTDEARRYTKNWNVITHRNRVEEALTTQLTSLYNVSSRIDKVISWWWNVGYLPDLKNIVDAILLRKFY
jgi:hypothetical protein